MPVASPPSLPSIRHAGKFILVEILDVLDAQFGQLDVADTWNDMEPDVFLIPGAGFLFNLVLVKVKPFLDLFLHRHPGLVDIAYSAATRT